MCARLAGTRPTAVNLFWAIDRMKRVFAELLANGASMKQVKEKLLAEAHAMYDEDIAACKTMGAHRRRTAARGRRRADALQRRCAGHLRLRHGARRHSRGRRAGQANPRLRRRDAALPAGRAPHRVGVDGRRHSDDRHLRQHGRRA